MTLRVLLPLAAGCEEMEAITLIDLLRRAGAEVVTAALEAGPVIASRGVSLLADTSLDAIAEAPFDLIVLPGGAEGSRRLGQDSRLGALLSRQVVEGRHVAAICAAPTVLGRLGLLNGRRATAYPGFLESMDIPGLKLDTSSAIVMDGPVITSRGPGTAMDFALFLIEQFIDPVTRMQVENALQRPAAHHGLPLTAL